MPDLDKLTGYRLPGAADRLSDKLKQDRAKAGVRDPKADTGRPSPSLRELDQYVTDTAGGKIARRREALEAQMESRMPRYKKGGMVKKTGPAILHKGERVLTKRQNKKMGKKVHK